MMSAKTHTSAGMEIAAKQAPQTTTSFYARCVCGWEGFKVKGTRKVCTEKQTLTEKQEKTISELTPEAAHKIRQAFTNMVAMSFCTEEDQPYVMYSSTCGVLIILMLLEIITNAGEKVGTLIDLASYTNSITHGATRGLTCEVRGPHLWSTGSGA